ncbi:centrosomal protein of 41 kDa isoform X1 [Chiloscyllium plagiosum]|uniref:centrosomal protein of 41 kDa isoform X1 n=1 Tax=Chiloscyllium plagiosum TaxID=36176 RepID=UPI001CB82BF7|nr:centrosomal protein of 41 kDa isoform X1 [Chiloscyllium plagiosum]
MSVKSSIGNPEFLKKRVVPNPKYHYVRARIDTGHSLSKYMEKIEELRKNYRYKRDELFKRLKVTTFAQLVLQVASVNEQGERMFSEQQQEEDSHSVLSAPEPELLAIKDNEERCPMEVHQKSPIELISNEDSVEKPLSARSTLQSVISGVGEIDLEKENQKLSQPELCLCSEKTDGPYPDCPYLLLDVRDRDAYDQCHIIGAYSYPIAMLSRTMNPYTKEILEYKNASGKIILLYDEDERIASQAATTLCERGFENLFMLSGGLKVVAQTFPEGLTTGSIPLSCQPPVFLPSRQRQSTPQEPLRPAEDKLRFAKDDLSKIQHYLDEILVPSNSPSSFSHLSSSRTQLKSSSSSVRAQTGSIQNKPWK